ncbi:ATP-binding protein [Terrabacter sp. 2RAF25]|uniref:ATP-binding protein n=1 Tax=Terrabacter sp. 2RAF25 TaxID=3232998 RepID=UPI003F988985
MDGVTGAEFGVPVSRSAEMQELFLRTDWSTTSLGPVETWPANLRSIADICLSSGFPMLVCWGPELAMVYNDGYRTLLGRSKHPAAFGRPVAQVWPEVWDVIGPMFDGVLDGGPATWVEDELLVVDRSGFLEEAYFTWSYGAIHDAEGNVAGILNVAVETTDKVLAVRRAGAALELFQSLTSGPAPETREQVRDRALAVLRARTADHLDADLVWTEGDAGVAATEPSAVGADLVVHVVPVLEPGSAEPAALLRLDANPRRPWDAQLQAYAELCASHVAMALSGVRRRADDRQREEALAELDVAKSDFFANVSHELRTPLALIAGPVQDALVSDGLDHDTRRRFEMIARNTDRLTGLVDRILDLTRVEAGAVEPHWVAVDVMTVTSGIAANFRPAIERMGLEFAVECDDLGREAHVDLDMFERIVLNLLSNALKFTPRGRIGLRLTGDSRGYEVSVSDTGIGIPEKDREHVFDRFRQLAGSDDRRSREGAGIGLSIVRQLVGLLGGSISLHSAEGQGSTFSVRLPWGVPPTRTASRPSITPRTAQSFISEAAAWDGPGPDDDEAGPPERHEGPEQAARAGAGEPAVAVRPTLLVVEDNPDMREHVTRHLRDDYVVVTARDGVEALALMRAQPPAIVLADVMMPRMDGLALVKEVRDDPALRDLPVVLLSARAGVEASTIGLTMGADDYVVKPFHPAELRARLAANLARSRSRSRDAAWLRAIIGAIREPLIVADAEGTVVELNDAFTRDYGWSLADGPFSPPYPWWIPAGEAPSEHEAHARRVELLQTGQPFLDEHYRIRRRGGGEAWVHTRAASVPETADHAGFVLGVARDETREREARMRRELAGRVAVDLAAAESLDQALATAVTGFTVLFDGEVTLRVADDKGAVVVLSPRGRVQPSDLDDAVRAGLESGPHGHDALVGDKREGLLLLPTSQDSECRAWVQFDEPRIVGSDELIVGDLLAQTLGQAVDRVVSRRQRSEKEHQLEQAIESHRLIGHAVGVLIERHRITAKQAFEMLRQASLSRNIKLREIAARVVESGQDPDSA